MKEIFTKSKSHDSEKDDKPKPPVNIFSKPVNVTQTEGARKSRLKTVIFEGLIFGAFLTAITAIYSISGLDLKLNPQSSANPPSALYFILEFVVFSLLVGVGDYFLTEKRVNEYNQKVAGLSFNIDDEIEKALKEQEADGISADDAAALNKSNGDEKPSVKIEIKNNEQSLIDKDIVALIDDKTVGNIYACKAYILDNNGLEHIILAVTQFNIDEDFVKYGVATDLFATLKEEARNTEIGVIMVSNELSDKFNLKLSDSSKYNIASENMCVCETYPGALMGVSGEYKVSI